MRQFLSLIHISCATYNEQGGWNEQDEKDLLSFLDNLTENNIRLDVYKRQPHYKRGRARQPRCLRHHFQTSRNRGVGINRKA